MATTIDLPDVNVWLALSAPRHAHHERARRYWQEESAPQFGFCRITSLALARLLTNAAVMVGDPLDVRAAWRVYQGWLGHSRILVLPEPDGCDRLLSDWAERRVFTPRLWTDAYLAAFARLSNARFVSFDGDFARFDGLALLHLV